MRYEIPKCNNLKPPNGYGLMQAQMKIKERDEEEEE
jgi:hypothetical protein